MAASIPTAAAEPVFEIASIPITNAMVNAWIAVVFFVVIALILKRKNNPVPRGIQNIGEAIVEFMLVEIEKVTGDRKRAVLFLPIVGTIFLFILFSNWLGLLPGTGTIGVWGLHHGETMFIPLLRPAASDLNLTLAIAIFAVFSSHIFGFVKLGFIEHISKFINIRGIFRSLTKGPVAIVVAVIEFGVGLIEIISEIAKVLSLSLRLFGNIFAGEVLLTVIFGLFSLFAPIPFMFLEILVGVIQATVFAMLTLAYLTVATEAHGHDDEEHHEEQEMLEEAHAA